MIARLAGELFLREVPDHLVAGLKSEALKLFGSVIRDASTGQIAGFLQEAAPLAQFLSSPVVGIANLGMEAVNLAQGEVLRRGIKRVEEGVGLLSNLGVGNLALGVTGIGVSIAGFAVLARRIDNVQATISECADKLASISTKVDQVRQDLINADLAELKALAKAMDEGWILADTSRAERQWHDVAKSALSQQSRFELRAGHVLAINSDFEIAEPLLDAITLANGLRVSALAACNESNAAHQAAADGAKSIERLTGNIGAADLVRAHLRLNGGTPGTNAWNSELLTAKSDFRPLVQRIREREAATATRTMTLAVVEANGASPREWLETARQETEAPILFVPPGPPT